MDPVENSTIYSLEDNTDYSVKDSTDYSVKDSTDYSVKDSTDYRVKENTEPSFPLECYDNRELSWLKFNERVLEEANDERNPLGERLSFLSIFQSNLDEFFMVRAGTLYDQRKTPICDNKTRMTAKEQLSEVLTNVRSLLKEKDRSYKALLKLLEQQRIEILSYQELTEKEKHGMERYFAEEVMPLLSPQIIAPRQPFPFLNGRDIYVVVRLKIKGKDSCLGIVPCSNPVLRRMVQVSPGNYGRYVLMEDLILAFADRIFGHYRVANSAVIRIVRNADISVDDFRFDTDGRKKDYRKVMEKMIQTRKKLCPIKLEYSGKMDADMLQSLCRYMKLPRRHTFSSSAPLDLSFLSFARGLLSDDSSLFYAKRRPQETPAIKESESVIAQILKKDVMLSFPYESIRPFVRLLNEAARNPEVASIRITLYRVAKISQITDALILAAENGKEVIVVMELRARFDEENNVEHSKDLEEAGCRVIYGLDNIKVHSKLCLITLKHGDTIEYITQIGTGNYNEKTAGLYTDYSLMTANREIGGEAAEVFRSLALGEVVHSANTLLVAPECLQNRICDKIDRQIAAAKAGKKAFIGFKVNALTDKVIIDKLIEASRAGVKIQLLVRGICCLVAGIPGYTDNVEVYSIVGRYLEHGRIYIFGPDGEEEVYIASADLMTRNTTRRVEVGVPILDPVIRNALLEKFRLMLKDTVKLRVQHEGLYSHVIPVEGEEGFCSQEFFASESYHAAGTTLPEERLTTQEQAEEKRAEEKHRQIPAQENEETEKPIPENEKTENPIPEADLSNPESVKLENKNPENTNSENIKPENIKPENAKPENVKTENAKPETAKPVQPVLIHEVPERKRQKKQLQMFPYERSGKSEAALKNGQKGGPLSVPAKVLEYVSSPAVPAIFLGTGKLLAKKTKEAAQLLARNRSKKLSKK